jgi:hypothetical protein
MTIGSAVMDKENEKQLKMIWFFGMKH